MIDEKRLIERLWEQHKGIKANAECYTDAEEVADEICNIVSIIEEQPKVGEWIPCSERLPQEDESVLITTKTTDKIYFGTYTKRYGFSMREGFICGDGFMWLNTAVAWMPLPPAYKGE